MDVPPALQGGDAAGLGPTRQVRCTARRNPRGTRTNQPYRTGGSDRRGQSFMTKGVPIPTC